MRFLEGMMIYDCFMFFNELDVLEIRLNELYDVVDKFVLVESVETHQGKDKPLYYQENKQRFKQFSDKIIHVVLEDRIKGRIYRDPTWYNPFRKWRSKAPDAWHKERFQRDQIMRGLVNCHEDDIIIVSDVDEIPRAPMIENTKAYLTDAPDAFILFAMPQYSYYLNLCLDINVTRLPMNQWPGSYALRYARLKGKSPTVIRRNRKLYKLSKCHLAHHYNTTFHYSGWHFSYLGGFEAMQKKLEAFAHVEDNTDHKKSYQRFLLNIVEQHQWLPVDTSFPESVLRNVNQYQARGLVCTQEQFQKFLSEYTPRTILA